MTSSYEDFLGSFTLESPDFKRALKILIKYEIHVLLQRLSDTGEESVVITASIADRTNGHLGSQKGRSFLRETQIKALEEQFLTYCTEHCYEQRSQPSDSRSPDYPEDRGGEAVTRYETHEMKMREILGHERNPKHNDTRSLHDGDFDRMDQSDDSTFDYTRQDSNSMTRLLSKLNESREIMQECYGDRSLVGRCNDICCRGSYLDLVGPFIRPAIPTIDKSSFPTNKDDDSMTESDSQSYGREQNYYDVVDLTVDKTERAIRDVNTLENVVVTSPSDESISMPPDFPQRCLQNSVEVNDVQGKKSDLVYKQDMLNNCSPVNKLNSINDHVEISPADKHTEMIDKAHSNSVTSEQNSAFGTKPELENRSFHAALCTQIEFENIGKRKLCSRVPECKLRSLLEADSNNMPSFIDKFQISVKQESYVENELEIPRSTVAQTSQSPANVNDQGPVDRRIEVKEKESVADTIKMTIKQEDLSSLEDHHSPDSNHTNTGRSLRFLCRYCGESFKNKQYRELHEKLHITQHPFVCESCGAGFDEENIYEEHSKIHITHPLLKCENCGYRTSHKFRMNSHREICGKPSKVFMCPYCQKPFLAKRYMKVHMKSHDLSNVHHCPYCVNTYPLKNSLLKHIKTKHKRLQ